ncbi:MAG: hypothetical protein P0S96_06725 [Simkaniaceae bacterium]|nr:hypothetical protein [Candidatus Sacchlamyda saccharinae]
MSINRFCFFCLLLLSLSSGFARENDLATKTMCLTRGIISHSPELIKCQQGDRIYLDEARVAPKNLGGFVLIDEDTTVYLPILFTDDLGIFTSASKDFWEKPVHQICNDCNHQWQGGVFSFRCPVCRSKNISNIRS